MRTTKDGFFVLLHDDKLDRTTNGKGSVGQIALAELRKLDAGSHFDPKYRGEPVATLSEVLAECKGKADVLLDLKETGDEYVRKVIAMIRAEGRPAPYDRRRAEHRAGPRVSASPARGAAARLDRQTG